MKEKVFIGVAWPYVNGTLHIGHLAGYLLPSDISARYHRGVGRDVLMVSGSDCFGTPITVEADKRQLNPENIVDEYHAKTSHLFKETLGLSYDLYTKTDHPNHIETVQDFFVKLVEDGYVYIDKVAQYYSKSEDRFLPDRYVVGECPHCHYLDSRSDQCDKCGKLLEHSSLINPKSNISGSPVELKGTEHYFLDWSKLEDKLSLYAEQHCNDWKQWVSSESKGWLKEGLRARAITRDLDWGVPIPLARLPEAFRIDGAESKRIYVWFDAVIGYLSASKLWAQEKEKTWEPFWKDKDVKHYYYMGKDNLVFHALFWPGQLMAYDDTLHLPDMVSVNMFLDFDGKKFSKSRGNIISIKDFVEHFGNDSARFYLTYIMPEYRDTSFSWSDFEDKVNHILVANLGNFIHRTLSIAKKLDVSELALLPVDDDIKNTVLNSFKASRSHLDASEFRKYLDEILALSSFGNKFIDKKQVWTLRKDSPDEYQKTMKGLLLIVVALAYLITPILPDASRRLFETLGLGLPESWPQHEDLIASFERDLSSIDLKLTEPLFRQVDTSDLPKEFDGFK